jgi:hydrogenase expression/formation protein HypE
MMRKVTVMGKLSTKQLNDMLKCIKRTLKIIVPPIAGFDSGVHEINNETCMVVSTDPCLGVPKERFGWFLIQYAASDVAMFGARPEYAAINLLGPAKTSATAFKKIMRQVCDTADELGISIITGHTGTYKELHTLIGTCTAYGFIPKNRLITPAGAKPHDYALCIKPIGLETLTNFALTHKQQAKKLFGSEQTNYLAAQIKQQTCVREAVLLAEIGGISAMHDATEGGFVAALNEIADASNVGFSIDHAKLPMTREMQILARHFRLSWTQAMSASSTGMLVAAVSPNTRDEAVKALSKLGIVVETIGIFTRDKKRAIKYDEKKARFPAQPDDPYDRIMNV